MSLDLGATRLGRPVFFSLLIWSGTNSWQTSGGSFTRSHLGGTIIDGCIANDRWLRAGVRDFGLLLEALR